MVDFWIKRKEEEAPPVKEEPKREVKFEPTAAFSPVIGAINEAVSSLVAGPPPWKIKSRFKRWDRPYRTNYGNHTHTLRNEGWYCLKCHAYKCKFGMPPGLGEIQ